MCYNAMFDAVKTGDLPAARLMKIILPNIEHETAVDILQDTFRFLAPATIKNYLHSEAVEENNAAMFALTMKLMQSGRFNEFESAMQLLLESLISFASSEQQVKLIYKWFVTGKATDAQDRQIEGITINTKLRHTLIRKIYGSEHIPIQQKKELFVQLAKIDTSDMLGRTEKFCQAADPNPDSKREAFMEIYERCSDMSLQHVQEMCRGFRQGNQKEQITALSDEFFARIEGIVNEKAYSLTRYIYLFTQPSLYASQEEFDRFSALKQQLDNYTPEQKKEGTNRLSKWITETLQEIGQKQEARRLSAQWAATQNAQANL